MGNNTNKILIIIVLMLGAISYGCIKKKERVEMIYQNPPEVEILGTWIQENDPSTKYIFTSDGICKIYDDDLLSEEYHYSLSLICKGGSASDGSLFLYLVNVMNASDDSCNTIEGLNVNNNGIFSFGTDTGRFVVLKRP